MSDSLPPDLAAALAGSRARRGPLGDPLVYFAEVTSTNDIASARAERGAAEGTTIVAASQTAGRGRLGRAWHSPADAGLYVSIVFRDPNVAPYLTLAGGVAVAEGIRAATGLPLEIKWPNDVVTRSANGPARRRKLAGILAEASSSAEGLQYVILGFGINLKPAAYPPEIADRASSVEAELGRAVDSAAILVEVLAALASEMPALSKSDPRSLLTRWRALAPLASGSAVECDGPGGRITGIAAGVAEDGALLVRVGGRVERIVAGEVIWR
ncbi:MAG TPA: biotin--[acetyl-CoA-carboxylase] ligase [Vicinamibacterales bacterium]|jgi:BirA family biotin operon repressor/biotin-[acetyl-CoA-carboxylase] ligase